MSVKYTATMTITAMTQEDLFEIFCDLVDHTVEMSNNYRSGVIDVEELDPKKLVYSRE